MSTDGEMSCISIKPEGEPIEASEKVEIIKGPKELPESIIQEYARATGQSVIRLKDLASRAMLGELVQRLGAARQGSAMFIESEDMIKEGIKLVDNMLQEYAHDPKAVSSLMKTRAAFVDQWLRAAEGHIASKKDSPDDSDGKQQNIPPPPLVPIQINNYTNQVAPEPAVK